MRERFAVIVLALFSAASFSSAFAAGPSPTPPPQGQSFLVGYDNRPEVRQFIDDVVARDGFVKSELADVFAHARYNDSAAALMNPTSASPPPTWSEYRARFVEAGRIDAGARFWRSHSADLDRASKTYGVPSEVIIGILGVETLYGRNMGNFRVIDVLTTLAFDYPNKEHDRSPFFREQLEDYLLMARDEGFDVYSVRGSYAGAIGIAQFMPGSLRHYAVDFDGDGIIDLRNSPSDAIGSVANFLAQHGWQRGLPAYYALARSADPLDGPRVDALVARGAEPSVAPSDLIHTGLSLEKDLPALHFTLVNLPDGDNPTVYLAGTHNFFVLTRYNRSYDYALAVIELGTAIRDRVDAALAAERAGFPVEVPPAPLTVTPGTPPVPGSSAPAAAGGAPTPSAILSKPAATASPPGANAPAPSNTRPVPPPVKPRLVPRPTVPPASPAATPSESSAAPGATGASVPVPTPAPASSIQDVKPALEGAAGAPAVVPSQAGKTPVDK